MLWKLWLLSECERLGMRDRQTETDRLRERERERERQTDRQTERQRERCSVGKNILGTARPQSELLLPFSPLCPAPDLSAYHK